MDGGLYKLPLDQAVLYNQMAILQNKKGDSEAARQSIQKSLELYQRIPDEYPAKRGGERRSLDTQGVTYTRLGLTQLAIESLEQSLALSRSLLDESGEATALSHLGDVYRVQNDRPQALDFYRQALAIYDRTGDKPGAGLTWHNLGETLGELQRWPEATEALLKAVAIWESLRPGLTDQNQVSLFETQAVTYERLQEALVEQNQIEAALTVSEQGRARAFVELLANRLDGQTREQFQQLQPLTIEEIRRLAQTEQATLVEYSILSTPQGDDRLLIWVIQPNGVITLRTTSLTADRPGDAADDRTDQPEVNRTRGFSVTRPVAALVTETREETTQGVTAFQPKGNLTLSEQLRRQQLEANYQRSADLLISPIADLLPTPEGARVIFVPHRSLFLIPFAALPTASGRRLIQDYTISVAPSLQVLHLNTQQANPSAFNPRSPLIVGNPTMPTLPPTLGSVPIPLTPLPGAATEATTIAQTLNTKALTGDQALESAVVQPMPQADLIHLATHGLIDELHYLDMVVPGAIALAPEVPYQGDIPAPDGLLTANEILDLTLQADLVVLSACNTGKGNITGDGVIGLSRSLMAAGVPSVVVSLWAVPDAPTAELMVAFYKALQQTPDKAAALRQAMLSTLQTYDDPTNWAAFVLLGSPR